VGALHAEKATDICHSKGVWLHLMDFSSEIWFRTSRSGGKGGQNVNKVETAVEALWMPAASRFFTDEEKARIAEKLAARMNEEGVLVVKCTEARTQLENKEKAVAKMHTIVARSLVVPKKRKPTIIPRAVKEKRLNDKKVASQKKEMRRKPPGE
jgi:ribosome-associated protein